MTGLKNINFILYPFSFQFLIGAMTGGRRNIADMHITGFQFLIGAMTVHAMRVVMGWSRFQFLIGAMTGFSLLIPMPENFVSIPYRRNDRKCPALASIPIHSFNSL